DMSKAFDTAWVQKLTLILRGVGIGEPLLVWLNDFLKHRKFRVGCESSVSETMLPNCGTPQGSVVSPWLFAVLVSQLQDIPGENCLVLRFADDILLLVKSESSTRAERLMQTALNPLQSW
ncbi:conserved hypothetical protein, partial [Perkinsus marinus ATCC 50983]